MFISDVMLPANKRTSNVGTLWLMFVFIETSQSKFTSRFKNSSQPSSNWSAVDLLSVTISGEHYEVQHVADGLARIPQFCQQSQNLKLFSLKTALRNKERLFLALQESNDVLGMWKNENPCTS